MTDLRKAAEIVLEAISKEPESFTSWVEGMKQAKEALRQALKQPEQEPVAWGMQRKDGVIIDVICPEEHAKEPGDYTIPLYAAPPKREWVGLTRRELDIATLGLEDLSDCYKAIEAKLKEKNGG